MSTIRALLVDDHAVFRESVARALGTEAEFEVTPCATIREALQTQASPTARGLGAHRTVRMLRSR